MILTTNHSSPQQTRNILLVDDDPADIELVLEMLDDSEGNFDARSVGNGVEALAFMRREAPFEGVPYPDLVLLDLNMPKMDGREVLQIVKKDSSLCHIPIMVLTTSDDNLDICQSYQLGANSYVTKPVGLPGYAELIEKIESFWFGLTQLPGQCSQ